MCCGRERIECIVSDSQNMCKKTDLDERLDLVPPGEFLAAHSLGDFPGVPLDASDDGVGVWSLLGALIELLDHDGLLACMSSLREDGNLSRNPSESPRIFFAVFAHLSRLVDCSQSSELFHCAGCRDILLGIGGEGGVKAKSRERGSATMQFVGLCRRLLFGVCLAAGSSYSDSRFRCRTSWRLTCHCSHSDSDHSFLYTKS
jgi:hypothetical protein